MRKIAVTMRLAPAIEYAEPRDAISHDMIAWLGYFGLMPILIPNTTFVPEDYFEDLGIERLLLSGGDSLGPLPGESRGPAPTCRDTMENQCLQAAIERDMPVLGICRGLTVINHTLGGSLCRHLEAQTAERHHGGQRHSVYLLQEGQTIEVNSYHHQGVLLPDLAPELEAFAVTDGDVVEGVRHKQHRITAIQWHPERPNPSTSYDQRILEEWLS